MMHSCLLRALLLLRVCGGMALPFTGLDLPRELAMDLNKAPYPIINVIADQQPPDGQSQQMLVHAREQERAAVRAASEKMQARRESARLQLDKQMEISRRLAMLRASMRK
mmetsp:Transcript_101950/g.283724  ORF Transcript_101950/g.283724 Transcript_101950/m.283724 type:complete len:110 (+) Transcript_101950:101-430(+)